MTRPLFIGSFLILLLVGGILFHKNVKGTFLIVFVLSSTLVFARRIHLGLKPWWGGDLKDIPKYFLIKNKPEGKV
jgi:hypothetical protein